MKRGRALFALAVVAGSLGWVALKGLSSNLVYFMTPTELLRRGPDEIGQRVRLGGLVDAGSVERDGATYRFIVSDGTSRVAIIDTGGVPSLFAAGKGVVVEGSLGADGTFHADTVLVKHGDDYRPPAPGRTPTSADLQG